MNGYIALYYLYLGQRCAEALNTANGDNSGLDADDEKFVTDQVQIAELGRMENTTIMYPLADWARLLALIPNAKPRIPLGPDTKREDMPASMVKDLEDMKIMKEKIAEAMKGNARPDLTIVPDEPKN